jgi:hypothetical protein
MKDIQNQDIVIESDEILQEKAFIHYILLGNMRAVSKATGINITRLTRWCDELGWEDQRKRHYGLVHQYVVDNLDGDLVPKQVELVQKTLEKLFDELSVLDEAEVGTRYDVWRGFNSGIDGVTKLLGLIDRVSEKSKPEQSSLINLSGEGQNIYIQAMQQIKSDDDVASAVTIDTDSNTTDKTKKKNNDDEYFRKAIERTDDVIDVGESE